MSYRRVKMRLGLVLFLVLPLAGCARFRATGTPPAGWRSPVSELLVDDSSLPNGWIVEFPEDTATDVTVNHVYRSWVRTEHYGTVDQQIWRAYTIAEARDKYNDLRQTQFQLDVPPEFSSDYVEFVPPDQIEMHSSTADEFYLACGNWRGTYCLVLARYRNYVVLMRMSVAIGVDGERLDGLTHAEISELVTAMDHQFHDELDSLPTP